MIAIPSNIHPKRRAKVTSEGIHPELEKLCSSEIARKFLFGKALYFCDFDWHLADDAVQDAYLDLLRCRTYDPEKSSPMNFAIRKLRMRLWAIIYGPKPQKHGTATTLLSDPASKDIVSMETESREVSRTVRAAVSRLHPNQRAVANGICQDDTLQKIGKELGVSRQRVFQLREVTFVKLKTIIGNSCE